MLLYISDGGSRGSSDSFTPLPSPELEENIPEESIPDRSVSESSSILVLVDMLRGCTPLADEPVSHQHSTYQTQSEG